MTEKLDNMHEIVNKRFRSDFSCCTISTSEKIETDYKEILKNIENQYKSETDR